MRKRGLSGVVTTILIILLVIISVGIIWGAIRPSIQETARQIDTSCFTIDAMINSCVFNPSNGAYDISMTRGARGEGLSAIKFIFNGGSSDTKVVQVDASGFEALETKTFENADVGFANAEVDYAFVVTTEDGVEYTCEPQNMPFSCTSS